MMYGSCYLHLQAALPREERALLAAQIRMCVPQNVPAENARDVVIAGGSRVSVVRRVAAISGSPAACATPANS